MAKELLDLYKELLDTANLQLDDKEGILLPDKDKAVVGDRQLMIPTETNLRRYDNKKQMFFHPLTENLQRGESEVFKFYKKSVTLRVVSAITIIGYGLLKLQEDPQSHLRLNQEQVDMILSISDADKKSAENWISMTVKLLQAHPDRMDKWLINFFTRRGAQFQGKTNRRVTVTIFPAYEYVKGGGTFTKGSGAEEKDLFRKKDYSTFLQVFESIFPEAGKEGEDYNAAYDGTLAAWLTSFLKAVTVVSTRLNYILEVMEKPFKDIGFSVDGVRIPLDWVEDFEESNRSSLLAIQRRVPIQEGNDGNIEPKNTTVEEEPEAKPAPAPTRAEASVPPPRESHDRDDRRRRDDRDNHYNDRERGSSNSDVPSNTSVNRDTPKGRISFTELMAANPDIARGTATDEEYRERQNNERYGRDDRRYDDRRDPRDSYRDNRYDDRRYDDRRYDDRRYDDRRDPRDDWGRRDDRRDPRDDYRSDYGRRY